MNYFRSCNLVLLLTLLNYSLISMLINVLGRYVLTQHNPQGTRIYTV
jgi:hypothetical protein